MSNLYIKAIDSFKISLHFNEIGNNLDEVLKDVLIDQIGDKCSKHGYIKANSLSILTHSSGILRSKGLVDFYVTAQFHSCCPSEGHRLECIVQNVTKAGIRANIETEPHVIIFVARDHNFANKKFINIKENEKIIIDIIGTKYELNDENIYIIGELVDRIKEKGKIVLKEK